jgi:catechol 2,3-dioxygenase-like lactoylglutathione lyase family enzyme
MLDHLGIRVSDLARSSAFYKKTLAPLSITAIVELTAADTGSDAGTGFGKDGKPFFWISDAANPSRSVHIAFSASSRAVVEAFYRAALAAGGKDNGPPGLRPYYHPDYFSAFVLDPDGNNIEAVSRGA